jgi:hypothetical protein
VKNDWRSLKKMGTHLEMAHEVCKCHISKKRKIIHNTLKLNMYIGSYQSCLNYTTTLNAPGTFSLFRLQPFFVSNHPFSFNSLLTGDTTSFLSRTLAFCYRSSTPSHYPTRSLPSSTYTYNGWKIVLAGRAHPTLKKVKKWAQPQRRQTRRLMRSI